jgi:hypothetical protein
MDAILQGLLDLAGVNAVLVLDGSGRLVAFRGKAVYDRPLCEQVGAALVKAIDSIQLQQEDWESIAASFSDGKLLLRALGSAGGGPHYLAVVADAALNPSFATVAIRVAANKLRKALEGGAVTEVPAAPPTGAAGTGPRLTPPGSQPLPSDSRLVAATGVSWSKASSSVSVTAADPASAAFLARCTKELARAVGPMSKVYVQEAIRRISADASYSMALRDPLVEDLAAQIEDARDRAQFLEALARA